MCHISTLIDLDQGLFFVESLSCKERLAINLMSDLSHGEREEINIHGQR